MKIVKASLCSFLICCFITGRTQDFSAALQAHAKKNNSEKIYLHYDKEYYHAGETVWFKAYLYSNGAPSLQSSNFYVRLTDGNGVLVDRKKYPVDGASVKGSIDLPDSLPQGNYQLTAYTALTLSGDPDFIYRKTLAVYNRAAKVNPQSTPSLSLQFFPESGNLVDGITSVVAFKAIDHATGKPMEIRGVIEASDGTTIPFQAFHDGMGKFTFRPDAQKTYKARINNTSINFLFPDVQPSGINLHVQDEKGGKAFTLARSQKDKANYQQIILVAQINNQVVYEKEIDFEDYPSVKGHLLTNDLPSGILHFTVFNKSGLPLAERLAFIDNKKYLSSTVINIVQKGLKKREENNFEITVDDAIQKSLSVSVTDAGAADLSPRESILSAFLLTGDLKGQIHNPSWYFQNGNDTTRIALDNLLLTHGWSRFNWKKVLSNDTTGSRALTDLHLLKLSGLVKDARGKEVKEGKLNIYIESGDSTTQNYNLNVGRNGRFVLDSLLFFGPTRIFYNYFDDKDQRPITLQIDSLHDLANVTLQQSPAYVLPALASVPPLSSIPTNVSLPESKQLEPVTLQAKAQTKKPVELVNEKFTTGAFRIMGKVNLDNINQPTPNKSINVIDYSLNQIRQLLIEGGQVVNIKNMSLGTGQKWPVALFLDETPADIASLRSFRMDEIALVKFYEPGFVGAGTAGPGGALAIYTKKSRPDDIKPSRMEFFHYNGFSVTKEFYSPDYSVPVQSNATDYRSTLYWNPNVYLDSDNKSVKFHFFNNDFSKRLRVVVEGFSADGKLIHAEKIIE